MLSCTIGVKNVNTIDYSEKELRAWSDKKILKCPVCGERLIYKHGMVRVPHFAHEKDKECTYTFFENETKEHASGKVLLYKWLQKLNSVSNLELESYIKETKQRPDLYFKIGEQKYVIEYQCSPITLEEFKERRELYKLNNIIDIWILGIDNFNFNTNGKIKMKVLDKLLFLEKKLYYLNAFNETIYKITNPSEYVKGFYKFQEQNMLDLNNFYIENGEIILNQTVTQRFNEFINYIHNKGQERANELLMKQKEIYNRVKTQIEEEKQIELNNKINNLLKNRLIYLYSGYTTLKKNFHVVYRGKTIRKDWLLQELLNNYDKIILEDNIHIIIPKWMILNKNCGKFFKQCFPNNKIIFVDRS